MQALAAAYPELSFSPEKFAVVHSMMLLPLQLKSTNTSLLSFVTITQRTTGKTKRTGGDFLRGTPKKKALTHFCLKTGTNFRQALLSNTLKYVCLKPKHFGLFDILSTSLVCLHTNDILGWSHSFEPVQWIAYICLG